VSDELIVENYTRDEFYGFMQIPFHQNLELEIFRPDADSTSHVSLPASPKLSWPDGLQSPAAVYTLAEATGAMVAADMLDEDSPRVPDGMYMAVLTTRVDFRFIKQGRGKITARGRMLGDVAEATAQLAKRRKTRVTVKSEVLDEQGELLGEAEVHLYFRIMRTMGVVRAMAGEGAGG
jgi:hypothetical protein